MATKTLTPMTYSASDVAVYLGISRQAAYDLLHADNFPAFRIGKRVMVRRDDFEAWVDAQREKGA